MVSGSQVPSFSLRFVTEDFREVGTFYASIFVFISYSKRVLL